MSRFLEKQLSSAESKKQGRVQMSYTFDHKTGRMDCSVDRADAKNKPPMVTTMEFPVGLSRGIKKP